IFTSGNPGLEKEVGHVSLSSVQRRIQTWLDRQAGFPPAGDPTEYSFYCERCYPLTEDRRAYFQSLAACRTKGRRGVSFDTKRLTLCRTITSTYSTAVRTVVTSLIFQI